MFVAIQYGLCRQDRNVKKPISFRMIYDFEIGVSQLETTTSESPIFSKLPLTDNFIESRGPQRNTSPLKHSFHAISIFWMARENERGS